MQEVFIAKVVKLIEQRNEDSQEIQSGWFTPDQMKTELKWSQLLNRKSYVHDVPTSEHLLKGLVLDIGIINMRDCKEFMCRFYQRKRPCAKPEHPTVTIYAQDCDGLG